MRIILIFLLTLLLLSCSKDTYDKIGNSGEAFDDCIQYSTKAVRCLRDFLIGEDGGGTWAQIGTTPEDLSSLLVGENPCFEWSGRECGQYEFMYIVGDPCCYDTSYVRPLKCCLNIEISCE